MRSDDQPIWAFFLSFILSSLLLFPPFPDPSIRSVELSFSSLYWSASYAGFFCAFHGCLYIWPHEALAKSNWESWLPAFPHRNIDHVTVAQHLIHFCDFNVYQNNTYVVHTVKWYLKAYFQNCSPPPHSLPSASHAVEQPNLILWAVSDFCVLPCYQITCLYCHVL